MLSTSLDVSAISRRRYLLELLTLVRSGMQARATETAQAGARRVVADGVCLSAVWMLTLFLASELGNRIRGFDPLGPWHPLPLWSLALLAVALILALIGYDRIAGMTALAFVATVVADPTWRSTSGSHREVMLLPVLCFIILGFAPRRRRPDSRRLAWLAVAAVLAVASSTSDDPTGAILLLALLLLVPPALALLPSDPRLAIACALPATSFGILMAQDRGGPGVIGVVFLSAAPLILAMAATRTRRLQARALS
jgi:hypothetical protein